MKVTQKPEVIQREMKMILGLRKIRPVVRPIKLNLNRKVMKNTDKASASVTEKQSKKSLIVSIKLDKLDESTSQKHVEK